MGLVCPVGIINNAARENFMLLFPNFGQTFITSKQYIVLPQNEPKYLFSVKFQNITISRKRPEARQVWINICHYMNLVAWLNQVEQKINEYLNRGGRQQELMPR